MIVRMPSLGTMGDLDPNAILSPSRDELASETAMLRERMVQLSNDWINSSGDNTTSQNLLARWDAFVQQVKVWDSGPDFIAHVIGTTWRDELIAFQRQFNGFLAEFQASGVPTGVPPFTFNPPAPSTLDRLINKGADTAAAITKPVTDTIKVFEYTAAAIGLAAVGYIFYLTFETGRTARSIAPHVIR